MDASKTFEQGTGDGNALLDAVDVVARHEDQDEMEQEVPLPTLELDDHHMQVRALNFWASLLDDRRIPAIEDLALEAEADFGPSSILLDFTRGDGNPAIVHVGEKLAKQFEITPGVFRQHLEPRSSFLGQIAEHFMPVLEWRAPRDFNAETVDRLGVSVAYRGVMLPFCLGDEDDTISYIYVVINWKTQEEGLEQEDGLENVRRTPSGVLLLDQEAETDDEEFVGSAPETSRFMRKKTQVVSTLGVDSSTWRSPPVASDGASNTRELRARVDAHASASAFRYSAGGLALADRLAEARQFAIAARSSEERSRKALYQAIGFAHDFSLAAAEAPEDFAKLVAEAGITVQARAPMTAVAKLVFGRDYEKTRLTEFAAALSHAQRLGIERRSFGEFLAQTRGGLKGVVAAERRLRREEKGESFSPVDGPRAKLAHKLRQIAPQAIVDLAPLGDEFSLVLVHRVPEGGVVMLGEIPRDIPLLERAARKLIAEPKTAK